MMEGLCEKVYTFRQKEYIYKRDKKGRLVTEMYGHSVADRNIGSAIKTFRKEQILKSKFPVDFWKTFWEKIKLFISSSV